MQFGVTYLETWGSKQPYVAFSHLNFVLVFLFLPELTWHQILVCGISHCCVLCQVFLVDSWMELVFHVFWSQHQVGMGLYWCGVALFVITHSDPCKPVDYQYSRSKVCIVSPVFEVFVSKVICVIVNVTVTPSRMSYSSNECAS
jgi:hypothetical protein